MTGPFVLLSGCSGGGKSTLLAELARRGMATVAEPGRRIVAEESTRGGAALPWRDLAAFARRALAVALADREAAETLAGPVVFDRGLVDAAVALESATGEDVRATLASLPRYARRVLMAPPWPEIYATDPERRHGLADAIAEYERLTTALPRLGYEGVPLPKTGLAERADFVLAAIAAEPSPAP